MLKLRILLIRKARSVKGSIYIRYADVIVRQNSNIVPPFSTMTVMRASIGAADILPMNVYLLYRESALIHSMAGYITIDEGLC